MLQLKGFGGQVEYQVLLARHERKHANATADYRATVGLAVQEVRLSKAGASAVYSQQLLWHQRPVHLAGAQ